MVRKNNKVASNKKMLIKGGPGKQLTLDDLPSEITHVEKIVEQKRQISINSIGLDLDLKRDEITLNVDFRLLPSKVFFQNSIADMLF